MSLSNGMEEYYQKVIQLQEKLRQSEDERLKLEMRFNEMLQMMKEEEEVHFKKLRSKYKQFLEEDRRRQQRNDKILDALDRIENRTVMWEAKTEKFKHFRKQYKSYLKYTGETNSRNPLDADIADRSQDYKQKFNEPQESKPLHSDKYLRGDAKDDIVQKYLQSLSSQKCKDDILQKRNTEKPPPESKYSNLGNINSVYLRNPSEKTDPEKTFDSTQLKTTKDLQNSMRQNSKSSISVPKANDYSGYVITDPTLNRKPPADSIGKSDDSRRGSVFSNTPSVKQRLDYNDTIRRSSQQTMDNKQSGLSNQSPEQVHDELERLLKQHKDENSPNYSESTYGAWNEEPLQKASPKRLQEQQQIRQAPADLPSATKPIPEYQPSQPVTESKDILKDEQVPKNPEIYGSQPVGHSPFPQPNETNFQKPESPYVQPQRRRSSIMENPDFVNFAAKNQNERALSQVTENQLLEGEKESAEKEGISNQKQPEQTHSDIKEQDEPLEQHYNQPLRLEEAKPEAVQELPNNNEQPLEQQYAAGEQPTEQQDVGGQQVQEYTADGQPLQQYDENGQPIQQYDENGQFVQQYYDENGQQLQQYDENGQPLQQYYDENGQYAQQYDENGQPLQKYNENDQQYYDNAGQPLQQFDENGQPIPQYDQNGQPIAQYDENGQPYTVDPNLHNQYDQNVQPVVQYDANGQPVAHYDENGQLVAQYDENGQPLSQPQYDENGQLIPQYDANGQLVGQYDENGQPLQQYYDENGQPIPYYAEGESVQQCDENGQPIQQQYDDQSYGDQQQYHDQQQDLGQQGQPIAETKSNVMEILDTDTESPKQETKVSNDSDFDFSNG